MDKLLESSNLLASDDLVTAFGSPTGREAQALTFAAHGFTPRETAAALGLSPRSVEDYLRAGKMTIGARSRAEIVQWAIRHGFFPNRPAFLEGTL